MSAPPVLPYGPTLTRLLPRLQHWFLALNRWVTVPALRAGLGPLLGSPWTGSMAVLRTRGRRTARWRDAPLGYVIRNGSIYVCAGFGASTHWLRNLRADPRVEVLLPAAAVTGMAEEVTDPDEWTDAMRALLLSMGVIGRWTVGDVRRLTDAQLRELGAAIPLVRIRVTGLAGGPYDPGGLGWATATLALSGWLVLRLLRRARGARA